MADTHTEQRARLDKALDGLLKAALEKRLPTAEELFNTLLTGHMVFRQGIALDWREVERIVARKVEDARLEAIEEH